MQDKKRILIVDDHELIIQGIICSLKNVGNFDVVSTNTCDEALSLLKASQNINPFTIIFTDLSFDNTTSDTVLDGGEELIRAIKNNEIPVKIAVVTGHTETNRVFNVVNNLNPDAYLLKSKCDTSELGFAISKMLSGQTYYNHEIHKKIMKRAIVQIQMDEIALQILKEFPRHAKISNLEGLIKKNDGTILKQRAIEAKLATLRVDLEANNNTDLILKSKELGIID